MYVRRMRNCAIRFVLLAMPVAALTASAELTHYYWAGDEGGVYDWADAANWLLDGAAAESAPLAIGDTASFDVPEPPYAIELDRHVTNNYLTVGSGDTTLDMGGFSYTVTNRVRISYSANETSVVRVAGGKLNVKRPVVADDQFILAGGSGSKGTLIVAGEGAEIDSTTRLRMSANANAESELHLLDGGKVKFHIIRVGASGKALAVVDNGIVNCSMEIATSKSAVGHVQMTGSETEYRGSSLTVGKGGVGSLLIDSDINQPNTYTDIYIGAEASATGTMTVASGRFGYKADGGGIVLTCTIGGGSAKVAMGETPTGGAGVLEVLDGGRIKAHGTSNRPNYFYIGERGGIRIRDGRIDWCTSGSNRNQPFRFRPGSFYRVELTDETAAFSAEQPLIWSGSTIVDGDVVTNLIENATLDLVLTDSYVHNPGDKFHIFRYDSVLEGEFAGLEQGSEFYIDNNRFSIDYGSLEDSEIVVRAEAPQGSILILR